ncbi:MAG: ATP-binding protein [Eubacteriales bacterium]|nr:ATP-binding protein [Eubacteriales bacterium]
MELTSPRSGEILSARRNKAIREADDRTALLHEISPEISSIDKRLADITLEMLDAAKSDDKMDEVKSSCLRLRERRKNILVSLGYPENFDTPRFVCPVCNDTGFVKLEKCACLKAIEAESAMGRTVLGKGLTDCTFDTFSLDYCTDSSMKGVLESCRSYAESFTPDSVNILMYGGTGLGKTHLAAAIAHIAAGKGHYVVYESSQRIISDCRKASFTSDADADDKYYKCQLLIIDDLGVEVKNEFNISALTGLIDRRIVSGQPMIISTNYDLSELKSVYNARLFSRILGEFTTMRFIGKDVRMIKIK